MLHFTSESQLCLTPMLPICRRSALHFDLSVFDIFGMLAVGGCVVLGVSHLPRWSVVHLTFVSLSSASVVVRDPDGQIKLLCKVRFL